MSRNIKFASMAHSILFHNHFIIKQFSHSQSLLALSEEVVFSLIEALPWVINFNLPLAPRKTLACFNISSFNFAIICSPTRYLTSLELGVLNNRYEGEH